MPKVGLCVFCYPVPPGRQSKRKEKKSLSAIFARRFLTNTPSIFVASDLRCSRRKKKRDLLRRRRFYIIYILYLIDGILLMVDRCCAKMAD